MAPLPPFVHLVAQRGRGDCTVCCLAMLLGVTYEDALEAMSHVAKHPHRGMYLIDVQRAALILGHTLVRRRVFTPDVCSGLLSITRTRKAAKDYWAAEHLVVLREGVVIDPSDGMIWFDYDTFVSDNGAKIGSLLTLKEEG